jgi:transcription-repair coupling factor (superfamily II helicase)
VLAGLQAGSVDICIGTHRLIQKDVAFKDLGLVIIDEEQRFGVLHKEHLKRLRKEVDVLTLTATPIPRTLYMALAGVRDISTMETPPEDRLPIKTYVMEYDEGLVREAIIRELERGGQVYFVHNRVRTIYQIANRLASLVPEARLAIGHGQLPEDQLEKVMLDFSAGKSDVLVCSTIIESGLDIPNVNTIIVHQAERLGLAQMYQLRGRVGRGANRAYAYFMFSKDRRLTSSAEARLRTIFEATELGAGFRIAMKDLEIRGAGNLLGAEQHGHVAAVGFDLYCRMLAEAVQELQGKVEVRPLEVRVDLPLTAYLPPEYVADDSLRLNLYQRLAAVNSEEHLSALVLEMQDRFGRLPRAALNLAYLIQLKLLAGKVGVIELGTEGPDLMLRLATPERLDRVALQRRFGPRLKVGHTVLRLERGRGEQWMDDLQELLELTNRVPAAPATGSF